MHNPPRFKKDLPGKLILLMRSAPEDRSGLFTEGATCRIERRTKAVETILGHWPLPGDDDAWWLKISLSCPHCSHEHTAYVPETWIAQGLVRFVGGE